MDNDKFQEAVLKHLAEIGGKLKDHDGQFTTIDQNFPKITTRLERIEVPVRVYKMTRGRGC
ncbi:hypothetical protein [Desulfosporosinus sp.]|uniref:hypothetical protein n=1 Tax=Desulfosporosinus sp. TaxID=157907 RepID=UPI0025BF410C|nr:hypothetical protein [Desulfosporosinus sp.]MBC2722693.1 hypothetical protein [Desulfosporosinus sp.]MBC2725824.1 hypothetical protein [Desulfosporosinus sp.]